MVRLGVNLLLLVILVANPLHLEALNIHNTSYVLSGFEDSPLWLVGFRLTIVQILCGLIIVAVLTYLVGFTFVPAGQLLGRGFQKHPRTIRAYSANILGSLAGIWLFNALSWASFTPTVWFIVAAGLVAALAVVVRQPGAWTAVALTALAPLVVWLGQAQSWRTVWSPYHRLTLQLAYADPG